MHRKGWVLDHDHETGKVRGVICASCNTGLGQFKDSPTLLQAAFMYVNTPRFPELRL